MPVTLDQLVAEARSRAAETFRAADLPALERRAQAHVPRGFRGNLLNMAAKGPAVIAELKKGSPSKGLIRNPFHVGSMAMQLADAGAAALSVLTEENHFFGSLANLLEASAATELPCLRKDFIVDPFQILEARAHRADAILLIVAALSDMELQLLHNRASDFGLDVLVEVHDGEELKRAVGIGAEVIGVNSRNLRTFDVDLNTPMHLVEQIPADAVRVAESGIHTAEDLAVLRNAGYNAFLIGESLMRANSPGEMLRELLKTSAAREA